MLRLLGVRAAAAALRRAIAISVKLSPAGWTAVIVLDTLLFFAFAAGYREAERMRTAPEAYRHRMLLEELRAESEALRAERAGLKARLLSTHYLKDPDSDLIAANIAPETAYYGSDAGALPHVPVPALDSLLAPAGERPDAAALSDSAPHWLSVATAKVRFVGRVFSISTPDGGSPLNLAVLVDCERDASACDAPAPAATQDFLSSFARWRTAAATAERQSEPGAGAGVVKAGGAAGARPALSDLLARGAGLTFSFASHGLPAPVSEGIKTLTASAQTARALPDDAFGFRRLLLPAPLVPLQVAAAEGGFRKELLFWVSLFGMVTSPLVSVLGLVAAWISLHRKRAEELLLQLELRKRELEIEKLQRELEQARAQEQGPGLVVVRG